MRMPGGSLTARLARAFSIQETVGRGIIEAIVQAIVRTFVRAVIRAFDWVVPRAIIR